MSYNEPPNYGSPPPPGGGGYGGQSPYGAQGYGQPAEHPQGTTILVLGILGLVCCGPLGIAAWVMGNKALKEIDSSGRTYSNRGSINAGRICGIIATVLMALAIVAYIILFAIAGSVSLSAS